MNNDYLPDDAARERYNTVQVQRLYFMRLMIASYILGVAIIAICLLVGIIGCWKRSPRIILATALIMLFAGNDTLWTLRGFSSVLGCIHGSMALRQLFGTPGSWCSTVLSRVGTGISIWQASLMKSLNCLDFKDGNTPQLWVVVHSGMGWYWIHIVRWHFHAIFV